MFCPLTPFQEDAYQTLLQNPDVELIRKKNFPCDCGSGVDRGKCCYMVSEAERLTGPRVVTRFEARGVDRGKCCYMEFEGGWTGASVLTWSVALILESVDEVIINTEMKATEQYFPVVLVITLYKVVLSFKSVDEMLNYDHSNQKAIEEYFPVVLLKMLYEVLLTFKSACR